jgi:hypothetical protein
MKYKLAYIVSLSLLTNSCSKKAKIISDEYVVNKVWLFNEGFSTIELRDTELNFISFKSRDTLHPYYLKFTFNRNKNLEFEYYLQKEVGFCGNGILHMDSATWMKNGNTLTIKAKGKYTLDYYFDYDIAYQIDSVDENHMKLIKQKEISISKKSVFETNPSPNMLQRPKL